MEKIVEFFKKRYFITLCLLSFVLLVFVFPRLERRGTFGLADSEYVTLSCPNTKKIGGTFTCNILLHNTGKNIYSVNANYDLAEKITYQSISINADSGFELLSVDENNNPTPEGFAVYAENTVTGEVLIGTVTFKVSSDATPNTSYKVGLNNIELVSDVIVDENYELFESDDYAVQIRTLNNVATLSNLSVTNGTLDKTFASSTTDYTATVASNVSQTSITATKTDSNATLSGTGVISTLNLHYGTNSYTIIVLAEDGETSKTYNIDIYREYEFSTNVYTYSSTGNYIYVGSDTDTMVINNIEKLSDGLQYNISNGNLEVVYGDEILASMKIVRFTSQYTIVNKVIHVGNDTTLGNITTNMTSDDVTFKLYSGNTEVTDTTTVIDPDTHSLKVYYSNNLIDTLTFSNEYLSISDLLYDSNAMMIKRLTIGTTYATLKSHIETSGTITVTSKSGDAVADTDVVKTGDTLTITLSNTSYAYKISVLGDVYGNGKVGVNDVSKLYKYYNNVVTLTPEQIEAGDVRNDGVIKINDVSKLYKYYNHVITDLGVGGN